MPEIALRMPKMSMTMTEGEVVGWRVAAGDAVAEGDVVCEVSTDKVDMEVESPFTGVLARIVVEEGPAPVGEPIAWITSDDDSGSLDDLLGGPEIEPVEPSESDAQQVVDPPEAAETAEAAETVEPTGAPTTSAERRPGSAPDDPADDTPEAADPAPDDLGAPAAAPVAMVPRARALAREHGVDLAGLRGTGADGLVLVADVEQMLQASVPAPSSDRAAPQTSRAVAPGATGGAPASPRRASFARAVVARRMTLSAAVPQFTLWRDLDLSALAGARGETSWTTVLLRLYAAALREVPEMLGTWGEGGVEPAEGVVVGLAVDTDGGLLVPSFLDPDREPLEDLARTVRRAATSARAGRVEADHLKPAVATLSNLGGWGVERFQALITPPQSSVLAVGAATERPVAVPGGLGLGLRTTVGLTVDHRVADGVGAARVLEAMADLVADPVRSLLRGVTP